MGRASAGGGTEENLGRTEGHRRATGGGGSSSEEALWGNLAPPPVGGDWTRQGRIVFAQGPSEPVKRGDGQEEGGWGGRGKGGRKKTISLFSK